MRSVFTAALCIVAILCVPACEKGAPSPAKPPVYTPPPETVAPKAASATPAPDGSPIAGKVLETMDAGTYTYVKLNAAGQEIWAAGPRTPVKVGDAVILGQGAMMSEFSSKTLNRTFAKIYFTNAIMPAGGPAVPGGGSPHGKMPPGEGPSDGAHGSMPPGPPPPAPVKVEKIAKAEGGLSVEEVFQKKAGLGGKPVVVRGKVVKYNEGIMNKNWLHIQDGSGKAGTNDLTVTTNDVTAVGEVITIRGTLAVDKDFGASYKYDLIVEGAKVTK